MAGCGYVWFGIRKGYTELDGKLLLNAQIWNYLLAFLMGKELPEVTEFEPDREICCQSEWLKRYEQWLRVERHYSDNSIGIRFRSLRVLYNLSLIHI